MEGEVHRPGARSKRVLERNREKRKVCSEEDSGVVTYCTAGRRTAEETVEEVKRKAAEKRSVNGEVLD